MRLLPVSFQVFILNRLMELIGILLIFLSCLVFLSIWSFTPSDPNINNLTNLNPLNIAGQVGANISDLLIQLFGYVSYLISIIFISWSYRLIFQKSLPLYALNILLVPFLLTTIASLSILIGLFQNTGFLVTFENS